MSIPVTEFLQEVLPYAPDVPEPSAIIAIRSAAIDLCQRTLIWQLRNIEQPILAGQRVYELNLPLSTQRVAITRMWLGMERMAAVSEDLMTTTSRENWRLREGYPTMYVERPDDTFELSHTPNEEVEGPLLYDLALAPSRDADEFGLDDLFNRHLEAVAAGALARVYRTMGQPYYNYDLSIQYERRFKACVNHILIDVNRGHGRGKLMVGARPFASGSSRMRK